MKKTLIAGFLAFLLVVPVAQADTRPVVRTVTADHVIQAQTAWIQALVRIGAAQANGQNPTAVATDVLNNYYDFSGAGVVFKPTLTHGVQTHRTTFEGALAYFVGGNAAFPDDSGFALTGYTRGEVDLAGFVQVGNTVIAQGNITLFNGEGGSVTVNKTFGYRIQDDGSFRIIAHHSSLPFSP